MSCLLSRLFRSLPLLMVAMMLISPVAAQSTPVWNVASTVTIETDGFAPKLSPDGRWVAGLKDLDERKLCIWRVSTGEERCNESSERVADASIAWSPDSRQVAFSQNGHLLDSDIFVLNVRSNSLTNYTDDEVDDLKSAASSSRFVIYDRWPVWNDDGSEIVFLRILDPRSDIGQRHIAVSRIVMETEQVVRGQDITTDEPLEYVAEAVGVVTPPLMTPDGSLLFALRGGADVAGVYVVHPRQQEPALVESDPTLLASNVPLLTGASADGQRLSFSWLWGDFGIDGDAVPYGWLDRDTGELHALDVRAPEGMTVAAPPRLSPDGLSVVYGVTADDKTSRNATIVVQDLVSGDVTEVATGVSLQLWEGVTGLQWTANDQLVVPLDDGSFEVITLERE